MRCSGANTNPRKHYQSQQLLLSEDQVMQVRHMNEKEHKTWSQIQDYARSQWGVSLEYEYLRKLLSYEVRSKILPERK